MKKIHIIILATAMIMGLLGIIFISIGIRKGFKVLNNSKVELSSNYGEAINKSYSINENIKEIYLEINAIQFEFVKVKEATNIEIELKNFLTEEHISFNVDGNKLTIKSLDNVIVGVEQVLVQPNLIISIPDNIELDVLDVSSRASDTYLNSINTKKIVIKNDAGRLVFTGTVEDSIEIENNAGKVDATLKTQSKNIVVYNNIGNINIKTLDINHYSYNINNNLGEVKLGDKEYTGLRNSISSGGNNLNIKISNKLGSVGVF